MTELQGGYCLQSDVSKPDIITAPTKRMVKTWKSWPISLVTTEWLQSLPRLPAITLLWAGDLVGFLDGATVGAASVAGMSSTKMQCSFLSKYLVMQVKAPGPVSSCQSRHSQNKELFYPTQVQTACW